MESRIRGDNRRAAITPGRFRTHQGQPRRIGNLPGGPASEHEDHPRGDPRPGRSGPARFTHAVLARRSPRLALTLHPGHCTQAESAGGCSSPAASNQARQTRGCPRRATRSRRPPQRSIGRPPVRPPGRQRTHHPTTQAVPPTRALDGASPARLPASPLPAPLPPSLGGGQRALAGGGQRQVAADDKFSPQCCSATVSIEVVEGLAARAAATPPSAGQPSTACPSAACSCAARPARLPACAAAY